MNLRNIRKYNLLTMAISAACLLLLYAGVSFLISPQSETFVFSSINPLEALYGAAFALGYGLGFPVWLSAMVIGVVSFLLFIGLLWITRKFIK